MPGLLQAVRFVEDGNHMRSKNAIIMPESDDSTKTGKKGLMLAADLLDYASKKFARHVCNDYKLPSWNVDRVLA